RLQRCPTTRKVTGGLSGSWKVRDGGATFDATERAVVGRGPRGSGLMPRFRRRRDAAATIENAVDQAAQHRAKPGQARRAEESKQGNLGRHAVDQVQAPAQRQVRLACK